MMLKRTSLILALLLGASSPVLAQNGNGNGNGHGNAERVTGLERAAQRHALKGERALAEGRRLLRHATLGAKPELSRRQQAAESSYRELKQRADRLLREARGEGAAADTAIRSLDAMLAPATLVDAESRIAAPAVQPLTALGEPATLRTAPASDDLQATIDAPHTDAILARAQALDGNPVRIHEWVRKSVRFVPTRGSIQGAQGTLDTLAGNATDIASLEIALLRASGIHARYVRGQIEIDAVRMQRWLGVDRVEAASEMLSEGGIAFEPVIEAGTVARFRLEHVWVEAWVDMTPSRGSKHATGDAWVALDASFKDLRFESGAELLTWLALDPAQLTTAIEAAARLDRAAGTLSALGADALGVLLDDAVARLTRVLTDRSLGDAELDALLARASDATPDLPYLMGTHSYAIRSARTPEAELPASERTMFELVVRAEDNGLPGGTLVTLTQPTVALYGKALSLRFVPATGDDAAVLRALLPAEAHGFVDLPEAVPAYLIEMRGELRLGNTMLTQTGPFGMGRGLFYSAAHVRPDGTRYEQTLRGYVGETRAFVQAWNNGRSGELAGALAALRDAAPRVGATSEATRELATEALRTTGLGHIAAANVYQDWLAGLSRVAWRRTLSPSSSYLALEVEAPFGLVMSALPQGVGVSDVSPMHLGAELTRGDESRFAREALSAQAAFGYQLLEQMYEGGARSATRVFLASLANQAPVHTLGPDQLAQFDALTLPEALRDPLRAGLAAGDRATFTAAAREVHGWTGQGAQQDYPDARGGTSFVYGKVDPDAAAHLTGANVTALKARGIAWSQWLGGELPLDVQRAWTQEMETFLAAGDGLVRLNEDPRAIALSPTLSSIIAGTAIHHAVAGRIDPLIDQHLWAQMLWPELSIAPILDPIAPTLAFSAVPLELTLGQSTRLRASISDNRPGASLTVTADSQPVSLSNGETDYTPTRAGIVPLVARGRDAAGNLVTRTLELRVSAPNDASAPLVDILAPLDNAAVTEPTQIRATVTDDSLVRWTLYLRPGNSPNAVPIKLAEGSQALSNAVAGTIDPTMMFNGVYVVILEAEDAGGRKSNDSIQVRIDGDMKLGHFSITFVDAEVPLAGIPIRITRTYDTRQSKESLDFGHGWSVDYQNVRVRESRKLGFSWKLAQQGGGFGQWCVKPAGSPVVTVTLPNGETEQFRARFDPECTAWVPTVYGNLVFEPVDPKTQSTLEQLDFGTLRWANIGGGGSNLIDLSAEDPTAPVDPSNYKLTTEDGTVYILDQAFGVRLIQDQAGNQISYSSQGIVHSSGTSIQFVRDAQKRITAIVLPDGRRLNYDYDANGDLIAMRDQADNATRYGYLPNVRYPHYLQDIIDARGVRVARNEYDDDGRLTATIDADGNRMEFVHDIAGHVERVKNKRGFETVYVYDDNGWVLSETNALGEQKVRSYDQHGNELSITDALGRRTEFKVDPRGNILEEKDALGGITKSNYGYYNQLYTETDPIGRVAATNTYARNFISGEETGYLSSTKDALGNVTQTPVDICGTTCPNTGNLKAIIDPLGNRTSFQYDSYGNVTEETDPLGRTVRKSYDAMGRVVSETRSRNVNGQPETLTTKFVYDAKGNLVRTEYPDGEVTKAEYDQAGRVVSETDALNRTTRFEYDNRGFQVATVLPDGSRETTAYDEEGNVISSTDGAGRTAKFAYDAANRLIETIHPDTTSGDADNPRTKVEYDKGSQVIARIDEMGARTAFEYDAGGRQVRAVDALGNSTTHTYDLAGQRLSTTDAIGRTTKFQYDDAGRMIATIFPDPVADDGDDSNNPRVRYEYDAAGRRIAETDEVGRKTVFGYDAAGRMTSVALGAHTAIPLVTQFEYDEQGHKRAQIDALGRRTEWVYDRSGRILSRKLPLGQAENFGYNAAGERVEHRAFQGERVAYEYDVLGRLQTVTFADSTLRKFRYGTSGQITEIDERGALYKFEYDVRDRLVSAIDSEGRRIDYNYDARGNRIAIVTPVSAFNYKFDELGRMTEVVANLGAHVAHQHATYQYDAVGNRVGQGLANLTRVTYSYDRRNRLSQMQHRNSAGQLMLGLTYALDPSGLRTQIVESKQSGPSTVQTRSASYVYDAYRRLTQSTIAGTSSPTNLSEGFTYDKVGNRLSRSCQGQLRTCTGGRNASTGAATVTTTGTYDANDRLMRESDAYGTYDYAYDDAGNLLSKKQGSTVLATYAWDIENRLKQVTLSPTGPTGSQTIMQYRYDASGIRRVSDVTARTVGSNASVTRTRTHFLVDPNVVHARGLEDWTAKASQVGTADPVLPEPSLQNAYVWGDDLLAEARFAPLVGSGSGVAVQGDAGNDPLARFGDAAGVSVYHFDGLGSTRLLSSYKFDASGLPVMTGDNQAPANETVTDTYAYTTFGESDIAASSGVTDNAYRFAGEPLDPNLSWYYLRARYMNPAQGRMVGMDSYLGTDSDPITLHKYLYANANPVSYVDPSGNFSLSEMGATMNMMSRLAMSSVRIVGRTAIRKARSVAKYWISSAKTLVRRCIQKPERCDLDTPLIIEGNDTPNTSRHVRDAQIGAGSNIFPAGVLFHRTAPPSNRRWYRSKPECKKSMRGAFGGPSVCDEFPYASTREGGPKNYPVRVSLRLVPFDEGSPQGVKLGLFYGLCRIQRDHPKKSAFLAIGMPEVSSYALPPPLSCFDER